MIREIPTASATPAAVSPSSASRKVPVTRSSVGALSPFGRAAGPRRPQDGQRPVDLFLPARLARRRVELRVPHQPVPQRREGERLQDVLDDAQGDPLPHHREIPRRRHRDHVRVVPGRPQRPRQLQPVHVRQMQIQQQQVHRYPFQRAPRLRPGVDLADGHETRHPADVHDMRVRRHRVVLHDQHANGVPVHRHASPPGTGADSTAVRSAAVGFSAVRSGNRTSNSAPPASAFRTDSVPSCRATACRTSARPSPRPFAPPGFVEKPRWKTSSACAGSTPRPGVRDPQHLIGTVRVRRHRRPRPPAPLRGVHGVVDQVPEDRHQVPGLKALRE